jgi:hypothetical protein
MLLLIPYLFACNGNKDIEGFTNIIALSHVSSLKNLNFINLGRSNYKIQLRFKKSGIFRLGNKIYDTDINGKNFAALLLRTSFVLQDHKGRKIYINESDILKENSAESSLFGNIFIYNKYFYVTIAYVDLKRGRYKITSFTTDNILHDLNPILIIGTGETGPL